MGALWHATWDSRRGVLAAEESMMLGGTWAVSGEGGSSGGGGGLARTMPIPPEIGR